MTSTIFWTRCSSSGAGLHRRSDANDARVNKNAEGHEHGRRRGQTKQTEGHYPFHDARGKAKPGIINGSRRKRIALGSSGTTVSDVNRMLKGFEQTKMMMKQMGAMGTKRTERFKLPFM